MGKNIDPNEIRSRVGENIKIDRVVTLTTQASWGTYSDDDNLYKFISEKDRGRLTTNLGKVQGEGINMGASPKDSEEYIINICEGLDVKKIKHTTIEFCIDVEVNYKLKDSINILDTFSQMLGLNNFKDTFVSYDNDGKEQTISEQMAKNIKGIKGKKSNSALKLYSKLEEKKIGQLFKTDIIRFELIYNSKIIDSKKIDSLTDLEKVKKEMLKYLNHWQKLLPNKLNRYTTRTNSLIEDIKSKIKN